MTSRDTPERRARQDARAVRAGGSIKLPPEQRPSEMRRRGYEWNGRAWTLKKNGRS